MGAAGRKAPVELVEVAASTPSPPSREPRPAHRVRWTVLALLLVAAMLAGGAVFDRVAERRHLESLATLASSGISLADVGPGVRPGWRVETSAPESAWVDDGVLVTVAHARGNQVVTGRDLGTGDELWRATFVSRLGSSRCTGQLAAEVADAGTDPLLVCALRATPRLLGADEGGTSLHVRSVRTGELMAERADPAALAGAWLVGPDLLGAWSADGVLEVRREDAVSGEIRWRLELETHEPVLASAWVEVGSAAGLLLVGTPREVFAVDPDGHLVFSHSIAPPRQPMRLALRPVTGDLFAVWQRQGRAWLPADLRASDGSMVLAGVGKPQDITADDGSLGPVLLTRHPDGDIVWDLEHRTKLWRARGDVQRVVVVGGLIVLETESGLDGVVPGRRAAVWRAPDVEQIIGIGRVGEVVASLPGESLTLVGIDPTSGQELWRAATDLRSPVRTVVVGGNLLAIQPRATSLLAVPDG